MRVEAPVYFSPRDDRIGFVKNQRRSFQVVKERIRIGVHDVFVCICSAARTGESAIGRVGVGEQIITKIIIRTHVIQVHVVEQINDGGEARQRVNQVLIMQAQELSALLVGCWKSIRSSQQV